MKSTAGNTVTNVVDSVGQQVVTGHGGDHFLMYINTESPCCIHETKRGLCVNYASIK